MGRALSSKNTNKTNATFLVVEGNHAYHFALSRTQILLGGVSISNQFSDFKIIDD
jgi:hypothetical protein